MASSDRAPKQWSLTKSETISSFEAWRETLKYILLLDPNFAPFLIDGVMWNKKSKLDATRGFSDDTDAVPAERRKTAAQKVKFLELMLGMVANYCPIISRNTITRNSTSIESVWQTIRAHFGFQNSGAQFLYLANFRLEHGERAEDLFQRLTAFF